MSLISCKAVRFPSYIHCHRFFEWKKLWEPQMTRPTFRLNIFMTYNTPGVIIMVIILYFINSILTKWEWSVISNNLSLKCQRFTPSGCKETLEYLILWQLLSSFLRIKQYNFNTLNPPSYFLPSCIIYNIWYIFLKPLGSNNLKKICKLSKIKIFIAKFSYKAKKAQKNYANCKKI